MPTTRPPSCCMASTKTDELAPRALALVAPAEVGCALPDSDELVTVTRELSLPELEPDLAALGRAPERELFLDLRWGGSALEAEAEARAEVRATPMPTYRMNASTAAYFLGNDTGLNSRAENIAEARFGIVGIGWQLAMRQSGAQWRALEAKERARSRRHARSLLCRRTCS